jgi:hypothetical protein
MRDRGHGNYGLSASQFPLKHHRYYSRQDALVATAMQIRVHSKLHYLQLQARCTPAVAAAVIARKVQAGAVLLQLQAHQHCRLQLLRHASMHVCFQLRLPSLLLKHTQQPLRRRTYALHLCPDRETAACVSTPARAMRKSYVAAGVNVLRSLNRMDGLHCCQGGGSNSLHE